MRKEEKTRRTYERILSAAIAEFGTKSYDSASLTTLCNENQISKGLVYHNFKNKDELYLKCVEKCFCEMTAYFRRMESKAGSMGENIQNLLNMRQKFFQENPYYCNIFFNTVLQPPEHLRREIGVLRQGYDKFYTDYFRALLQEVHLREGITADTAMEYFMIFFEMFNGYFQSKYYGKKDMHALMEDHEVNVTKILDIMLYGLIKQEEGKT